MSKKWTVYCAFCGGPWECNTKAKALDMFMVHQSHAATMIMKPEAKNEIK